MYKKKYKTKHQQLLHCGILLKLKDEILKKEKKRYTGNSAFRQLIFSPLSSNN